MPSPAYPVSIHPYFQVRAGQMPAVKALLREFIARTAAQSGVLYYDFTIGGDVVFCREAYVDAAALLAHVADVAPQVERMLTHSDLLRIEIHGPAAEIEKLREPLAGLKPTWYVSECGIQG